MDVSKISFFRRVSTKEKALFSRSLSATISAGLPIVRSLSLLAGQTENKYFAEVLNDIIQRLEQGEKFSVALSRHRDVFDRVYVSLIQAAEASGKFEQILKELADRQEKEYKLESSIKGAISYPIFIIIAMIVTAVILMVLVVPKIKDIFDESNIALPWATRALIGTSDFLANYWYIVVLVVVGLIIWLRYYFKTVQGNTYLSRAMISIPVVREFFINIYMTRFTKTFGLLISSGVPIIQAVELVSEVLNNAVYTKTLDKVRHELERGISMSAPLAEAPEFPDIVSQMILVGEQTGKIDEVMASLSKYFEEESARSVQMITSLLEPILLIIVGGGVGTIVFAIIVPLYQVSSAIK